MEFPAGVENLLACNIVQRASAPNLTTIGVAQSVYQAFRERVTRIELAFSAWEADVLPLNYTRGGRQL